MNNNKQLNSFVDNLIRDYSVYDSSCEEYVLNAEDLIDSCKEEFSAQILLADPDYIIDTFSGSEKFSRYVFPSLIKYLQHPENPDNRYDLLEHLRECITEKHLKVMNNLIEERLYIYNNDIKDNQFYDSDDNWSYLYG